MIRTQIQLTDNSMNHFFDATSWFETASDDKLAIFREYGFIHDALSEEIVSYARAWDWKVSNIMDTCRVRKADGEDVDYVVTVYGEDAIEWLEANRPVMTDVTVISPPGKTGLRFRGGISIPAPRDQAEEWVAEKYERWLAAKNPQAFLQWLVTEHGCKHAPTAKVAVLSYRTSAGLFKGVSCDITANEFEKDVLPAFDDRPSSTIVAIVRKADGCTFENLGSITTQKPAEDAETLVKSWYAAYLSWRRMNSEYVDFTYWLLARTTCAMGPEVVVVHV